MMETLFKITEPEMLFQNPPSIPALVVCAAYCSLGRIYCAFLGCMHRYCGVLHPVSAPNEHQPTNDHVCD